MPGTSFADHLGAKASADWSSAGLPDASAHVSGDFTFDTPKHYTATIQSKGTMGGREVVNSSVAIVGEHLGECQ